MTKPIHQSEVAGMKVEIYSTPSDGCRGTAQRIASIVKSTVASRGNAVLGLATGATPEPLYQHLIELYAQGILSFEHVTTYNLDEYYPISPLDPMSYRFYMDQKLFSSVDVLPNRTHVLDGSAPESFAAESARAFDRWIDAEGGLDLQLLGIGRNGHIGFNEPTDLPVAQALELPTRVVSLHPTTLADAARSFGGEQHVPPRALTMGVKTILAARSILVLAFGETKADPVARALKGPVTAQLPASLLQTVAGKVTWILDQPAAQGLL